MKTGTEKGASFLKSVVQYGTIAGLFVGGLTIWGKAQDKNNPDIAHISSLSEQYHKAEQQLLDDKVIQVDCNRTIFVVPEGGIPVCQITTLQPADPRLADFWKTGGEYQDAINKIPFRDRSTNNRTGEILGTAMTVAGLIGVLIKLPRAIR